MLCKKQQEKKSQTRLLIRSASIAILQKSTGTFLETLIDNYSISNLRFTRNWRSDEGFNFLLKVF